jgi:hypothetical protein
MSPLVATNSELLRWEFVDPSSLLYELCAQRDGKARTLASLRWGRHEALTQCAGEEWTLQHRGFWTQRVIARPLTSQTVADLTPLVVRRTWRLCWRWPRGQEAWLQWRHGSRHTADWICEDQARAPLLLMDVEPKSDLALDATARLQVLKEPA